MAIGLRVTNNSQKPMKYTGWSRPDIYPTLRDGFGNFFNRVSHDTVATESTINAGDTITDRLVYEKTSFMSELRLDLPFPGSEGQFQFTIPTNFIERPGGPPAVAAERAIPERVVDAARSKAAADAIARSGAQPQPPTEPIPPQPEKYDPERDEKLRAKIRSDYREKLADINQRKLGMSSNEGTQFKRRELARLLKRLASDNELTEDQVKRMAGLK
jgi:hypothetical protein